MTTFDERENAFENKFAHDAEMQCRGRIRRSCWVSEMRNYGQSAQCDAYAREVIKADFQEAGDEDVYRKVAGDLGDKADEATIRTKMRELLGLAKAQLMDEG
ncbi:MAG: DUF1476 domain-containing protein [Paracoccaceae bacterium]